MDCEKYKMSGVIVQVLVPDSWCNRSLYQLEEDVSLGFWTVPKGYVSDGATVPRILWPLFPPIGRYLKATLVHDYLITNSDLSRKECDQAFLECLKILKITGWRASTMYFAVRLWAKLTSIVSL